MCVAAVNFVIVVFVIVFVFVFVPVVVLPLARALALARPYCTLQRLDNRAQTSKNPADRKRVRPVARAERAPRQGVPSGLDVVALDVRQVPLRPLRAGADARAVDLLAAAVDGG